MRNDEDELVEQNYRVRLAINGVLGPELNKMVQPFGASEVIIPPSAPEYPLVIDSEHRVMPRTLFEVRTEPSISELGEDNLKVDWYLRLTYDEGNYTDIDDEVDDNGRYRFPGEEGVITVNGSRYWLLVEQGAGEANGISEWPRVMGAQDIYVNAVVSVAGSDNFTVIGDGFEIKGENPTEAVLEDYIESESDDDLSPNSEIDRALKAMVWKESANFSGVPEEDRPYQFFSNETGWGSDDPALPLVVEDAPDDPDQDTWGWGLTQLTLDLPERLQVWDWQENLAEGIDRFETAFTESRNSITSGLQDYYHWREQNAEGLRERAEELEDGGDIETAEQLREAAAELEWSFNPRNHDNDGTTYSMRSDLSDLENSIDLANLILPGFRDGQYIFHGEDVEDAKELPELENRSPDDEGFDSNHLDGESVFRVWAYNSYFRFNSSRNFLFDEYGIPLRNLDNVDGGPNLDGYIDEYNQQNWQ